MKRIVDLILSNKSATAQRPVEISADASEATVYLFTPISDWMFDPAEWCAAFCALTAPTIHLRVNSPGGDVFIARTMAAAMASHSSKVIAHVDGYAASAASFLVLAADEIEIASGGMVMIHDPWTVCWGNAIEMRECADLLDKVGDTIRADYCKRTGLAEEEVRAMMAAETWMSADEAVKKGFCDRITETVKPRLDQGAENRISWDFSAYRNAPRIERTPDPFAALASARNIAERRLRLYQNRA